MKEKKEKRRKKNRRGPKLRAQKTQFWSEGSDFKKYTEPGLDELFDILEIREKERGKRHKEDYWQEGVFAGGNEDLLKSKTRQ